MFNNIWSILLNVFVTGCSSISVFVSCVIKTNDVHLQISAEMCSVNIMTIVARKITYISTGLQNTQYHSVLGYYKHCI